MSVVGMLFIAYIVLLLSMMVFFGCRDDRSLRLNPKGDVFGIEFPKAAQYESLKLQSISRCEKKAPESYPKSIYLKDYDIGVEYRVRENPSSRNIAVSMQTADVISFDMFDSVEAFSSEYAALYVLRDTKMVPTILEPVCGVCNMVVTDFEGQTKSLRQYFESSSGYNETLATMIGIEAMRIIRMVHSYGIVHGSIPLDSFVYDASLAHPSKLKLVDWGSSSLFVNVDTEDHIVDKSSKLSRRDDMAALGTMVLTLLLGEPPFEDVDWAQVPPPFRAIHTYSRSLGFRQRPRLEFLIRSFIEHSNRLHRH